MASGPRPNVLIITTHDTGRHLGCYGLPTVVSPAIDALASQSVRMSRYFSVVPICSASRVCMLTGLYPQTHGQYDLPIWGYEFHEGVRHLSHYLHDAGYQTHLFGMQHETNKVDRLAFDTLHAQTVAGKGWATAPQVAAEVTQFLLGVDRSRPFYAQVGFLETHSPFTFGGAQPDHSRGVFVPPYLKPTGAAYELLATLQGAVRQADQGVAVIEQALREAGLAENTLLIVTTDHGVELPRAKWHLYDPGTEIFLLARWPAGGIGGPGGGRTCDQLASNVDFTPTVLDLLGIAPENPLQGASLAPSWRNRSDNPLHQHIFGYYIKTESRCVRSRDHKLIINAIVRGNPRVPVDIADTTRNVVAPDIELYDLNADPVESRNLANSPEHAAIRDELLGHLYGWMEQVQDPLLQGPMVSPAYHKALGPYRQLQAQRQAAGNPSN